MKKIMLLKKITLLSLKRFHLGLTLGLEAGQEHVYHWTLSKMYLTVFGC